MFAAPNSSAAVWHKNGIEPFDGLIGKVMSQEPDQSAGTRFGDQG
jgi:hypothetical protein